MTVPSFLNYTPEGPIYADSELSVFITGNFAYFILIIIVIILCDFFAGD